MPKYWLHGCFATFCTSNGARSDSDTEAWARDGRWGYDKAADNRVPKCTLWLVIPFPHLSGAPHGRKRPRVPLPPTPSQHLPPQPHAGPSTNTTPTTHRCPECLQTPCVVLDPPPFLKGSGYPDTNNAHKRYNLYKKFWSHLNKKNLWHEPEYVQRKMQYTTRDDPRELMPWCISQVKVFAITVQLLVNLHNTLTPHRKYDDVTLTPKEFHTRTTRRHFRNGSK